MSRGGNLLFPLILALIVGLLLYFYWGASSQAHSLRTDNQVMKKELSSARNERDNIQYRLNLLKEDLELAVQRKEEAERKEKEEHESAEQAKGQLKTVQEQLDRAERQKTELKKETGDLEEQKGKAQEQANDYQRRLTQCEAENTHLKTNTQDINTLRQQNTDLQSTVQRLNQENQKITLSLNEATERQHSLEQRVRVCEEGGGGGMRIQHARAQSWAQPAANALPQRNHPQDFEEQAFEGHRHPVLEELEAMGNREQPAAFEGHHHPVEQVAVNRDDQGGAFEGHRHQYGGQAAENRDELHVAGLRMKRDLPDAPDLFEGNKLPVHHRVEREP